MKETHAILPIYYSIQRVSEIISLNSKIQNNAGVMFIFIRRIMKKKETKR
jgi:hypothetical protein